ncbi:MAG: 2Fe-2S iron-sulfur cluster binding domain-containing protein [Gammaproteobacteria bacterium]|nr:2Fe-2S iron-sulfur cluster binding domain-containing protein [Gammaproteobacteria bacterium]
MSIDSSYHEGEIAVQTRAGETRSAEVNSGVFSPRIPVGAMPFVGQQAMAVFGSIDGDGDVWASVLFGKPGFIKAVDQRTVHLQRQACHNAAGDPLWDNLDGDPRLGMLLIELLTRRRLRVNGTARRNDDGDYVVEVARSYANCPQFIQRRRLDLPESGDVEAKDSFRAGEQLSPDQQAWIAQADTFFVASAHPEQGLDASHRGGRPGFVKVLNPRRLRIPDFFGNSMFNTLGNFTSYPRAGLVFIDFEGARVLQLSGRPTLLWDEPDALGETGGTSRFWEFEVKTWRESELSLHLSWRFFDYSPFIPVPLTPADRTDEQTLNLAVSKVWDETERVKGFLLVAADGGDLPPFDAGAHLPVTVRDKNGDWVERNYSLLSDPSDLSHYRIAVLAEPEGRGGSMYMHESLRTGDLLIARPPRNGFPLDIDAAHTILIAGGIGITPLLSMARVLRSSGSSFELHYSARRESDLAFRFEIERLAGAGAHFYASETRGGQRLDLQRILAEPVSGTHVYVCGPFPMIGAVRELAEAKGWAAEQIHFESFGATASAHDRPLSVTLAKSGKTVQVPVTSSILDVLLDEGVAVPHRCKRGECSLCVTRVLEGEPDHRDLCLSAEEKKDSMCVCVSRAKGESLTLDL